VLSPATETEQHQVMVHDIVVGQKTQQRFAAKLAQAPQQYK